jgi:hypothetical protein
LGELALVAKNLTLSLEAPLNQFARKRMKKS